MSKPYATIKEIYIYIINPNRRKITSWQINILINYIRKLKKFQNRNSKFSNICFYFTQEKKN